MNTSPTLSLLEAAEGLERAHHAEQAANVEKALLILAMVDHARVDEAALVEGTERWIAGVSDGTPLIAEFIIGEISAILGVSPEAAFVRVASLLNLRHRHPTLFRLGIEGHVWLWEVLLVADRCASARLSAEACARFDGFWATALRFQPWSRVRKQVERWIIQADRGRTLRPVGPSGRRRRHRPRPRSGRRGRPAPRG